jgi:hypothetical protein
MGGDCSQKLLLRRGWHSSPGRSRSSDQYAIHNFIAKMVPADSSFSRRLFFSAYSGADVSLPWDLFSRTSSFFLLPVSQYLLFETSSTAAGVRSPPPNIGGVVPAGPPKWRPPPPPLT